ncbi:MAG: ribonuclease HII [SAR202 cluster bacterium]|nr:ribonuclease HII [SAR202 cluster bacterium]|tara:strand:+ start:1913 stop:2524 length:612 start_codon:yes stop_codon:yes gene_type:complete
MPSLDFELDVFKQNYTFIAGLDEVGRGTIAGPVVSGAVVLDLNKHLEFYEEINDSKKLTSKKRNSLSILIKRFALTYGIGISSAKEIDQIGIVPATKLSMIRAINHLAPKPEYLLIDSLEIPEIDIDQTSLIKGDNISLSIAAASIIAKVARDKMMEKYDKYFPNYTFKSHKGYYTKSHASELIENGVTKIHRKTFAPIKDFN